MANARQLHEMLEASAQPSESRGRSYGGESQTFGDDLPSRDAGMQTMEDETVTASTGHGRHVANPSVYQPPTESHPPLLEQYTTAEEIHESALNFDDFIEWPRDTQGDGT